MGWLILAELWLAVLLVGVFVIVHGPPWRAVDRVMAWHIVLFTLALGVLVVLLLLAVMGVGVPAWAGALTLAGLDVMLLRQVALMLAARRRSRQP